MCQTLLTDHPNVTNIYNEIKVDLIKLNASTHNLCDVTADGAAVMESERKGVLIKFVQRRLGKMNVSDSLYCASRIAN